MKKTYIILIVAPILLLIAYLAIDSFLFDGFKPRNINQDGFQANLYAQNEILDKAAVVLVGGGQWGNYWGEQFAKQGFVGLSIPYTRNEGLPKLPEEIPLEYFEKAIKWLSYQPEVNPERIIVMGASRNAELALVIASILPELVSGAIAYAPSSVSWSNTVLPFNSNTIKASWMYNGEDIPYVPMNKLTGNESSEINTLEYWQLGLQKLEYVEVAAINVEKISGPILLFSGKNDGVWPSALMADMIEKRVKDNDFQYAFENIQYENAGHLISSNPDSDPDTYGRKGIMTIDGKEYEFDFGGTMEGDNQAKKRARTKVFGFMRQHFEEAI